MALNQFKLRVLLLISVWIGNAFAAGENNPCADRNSGGLICASCEKIGFCVKENGAWKMEDVAYCNSNRNYACDKQSFSCQSNTQCAADLHQVSFNCQMEGYFPDPYDCRKGHNCNAATVDTEITCSSTDKYSVALKRCKTDASDCTKQFQCRTAGDFGVWPDSNDPIIFYECRRKRYDDGTTTLYPVLYSCKSNEMFVNGACVKQSGTRQTELSAFDTASEQKSRELMTSMNSICLSNRLFPDGDNCRGFLRCIRGEILHFQCPRGMHFSYERNACVKGDCEDENKKPRNWNWKFFPTYWIPAYGSVYHK